ncbi:MAG: protein kinase [Chthoniobacteraceae bacterium]
MIEEQTEPCTACGSLLEITGAPLFAERTCPVCGEQIHVHRQFAHYELLAMLGQGGQGTVYRAKDLHLDRQVALKVLRLDQGSDPAFVQLFEHEAKITASINHPNVVRVYSFGTVEDRVYLAMELVDGGTFDDLLEKLGRVPEVRVLEVGIQVAQGLRAGFEMGLIHRDVKPGNILFAGDGSAKVVDFGLAVFHEQEAAQTGDIWGTPYYLSPERLNREQEDFRSDIYSLGATLFHAIAGRPPFEAEDASQVALKHLRTQAVSLQTFAPSVSNATAYVINRTLLKNRDERPASYDEFIKQLQYARDEVMARVGKGGAPAPKSRVVLDDAQSKKAMNWLTMVIFVMLLAGLGIGGYFIFRGGDDAADGTPAKLESFGPGWAEAKQLLMDGKWKEAKSAFATLAGKSSGSSKQFDWAIIHEALAAQFAAGGDAAAKVISKLPDSSTPVRKFFVDHIRPKLAAGDVIPAAEAGGFNATTHESLGTLFLALRDYELGDVGHAGPLFSQFTTLKPEPALAWLSDYKQLAKPYENEFITFNSAADAWKNARNEREQVQALGYLRTLPGKLPQDSKLLPSAKTLLAEAQRRIDALRTEKNKNNFAFKAKARASASNQNEGPEKAVDGDPGSRWSAGGNAEKWIALDLGAARNISHWTLTTSSITDGKTEQNLNGFKLQRSDDGSAWTDVDKVEDNRSAIVDRMVAPFTAKQVRILITRETRKPADKNARIQEIVLTGGPAPIKPSHGPSQSLAMRFSLKSDFLTGPVGDTGAAGSVQFSEADGKFTVKGSGSDIWANADAFQFVWQPVAGDCELVAQIASVQPQFSQAKVGLMIRADFAKDASEVSACLFAANKIQFLSRAGNGKPTTSKDKVAKTAPIWLKLVRKGAVITCYDSADGKAWAENGHETLANVEGPAFVGLAVCSHVRDQLATAVFTDVKLQKAAPAPRPASPPPAPVKP